MVAGGGCLDFLILAYGGKLFLRCMTREHCFPKGWRSSLKASMHGSFWDLPEELLYEIIVSLPVSAFACFLNVSRSIHQTLEQDSVWKRLSLCHWPCAAPSYGTWRQFVHSGGGARLGKVLLKDLQMMAEKRLKCPDRHDLVRFRVQSGVFTCDSCGIEKRLGPKHECVVAWGCRICNYDHCETCVMGSVTETVQGAANSSSDEGWTSLHYACRHGLTDVAASLLDAGADVEVKDLMHGYTPLMVSATHGHADVCSLLLSRGAAKETRNKWGKSAHACATSWHRRDLLPMLSV